MDHDAHRQQHLKALSNCVTEIVNASDPMNLLHHAPDDEYSAEVAEILAHYLRLGPQVDALTQAIQDTFDHWFGPFSVPLARSRFIASRLCEVLPGINNSDVQ